MKDYSLSELRKIEEAYIGMYVAEGLSDVSWDVLYEYEKNNVKKLLSRGNVVSSAFDLVEPCDQDRIRKIWNDYARFGFVADESGIDEISENAINTISMLKALYDLDDKDNYISPEQLLSDCVIEYGYESLGFMRRIVENSKNDGFFSNCSTVPLCEHARKLIDSKTSEEKLQILDAIFHEVHARGDISKFFVKDGVEFLNSLSSTVDESSVCESVDDLRFKFLDEWDAKRIVSSISRRTDNKRMNVQQFKKYYTDPKKRWFGCFLKGKCMSLAVLKRTPQDKEQGIKDIVLLAEIQSIVKGYGKPLIDELLSRYPNIWWAADSEGGESLKDYYRQFVGEGKMEEFAVKLSGWSGKPQSFFWRAEDSKHEKLILGLLRSVECGDKKPKSISFPEHECERLSKKEHGERFYTTRVSDDYSKYSDKDLLSLDFGRGYKKKKGFVTRVWDFEDVKEHPFYDELTDKEKEFLGGYKRIKMLEINVI